MDFAALVGVVFLALVVVIALLARFASNGKLGGEGRGRGGFARSLKHKHVFITGGSSGIGLAIACQALQQGAFVTLVSRTDSNLESARERLLKQVHCEPGKLRTKVADVREYNAIASAVKEAHSWKAIDVLICNAGLTRGGLLDEASISELELTVGTNLTGTIYTLHAALPLMKQESHIHPSSVVIMGSLASLFLMYGHSVYTATKYALRGLAEGLRLELLPFNIKVSLICPYFVDTPFLDEADKEQTICELMKSVNLYDRARVDSAEHVARSTLKAVKNGEFLVTTETLGFFLATLARGFMPSDSFWRSFVEAILFFPVRFITTKFVHDACTDIMQMHHHPGPVKPRTFQSILSTFLFRRF